MVSSDSSLVPTPIRKPEKNWVNNLFKGALFII